MTERFARLGFPPQDTLSVLRKFLLQNLIIADHMRATDLKGSDLIRVHASGFIHARILAARVEYIASCSLTTPLLDRKLAEYSGQCWHINHPYTDIKHRYKNELATKFINYLEIHAENFIAAHSSDRAMFIGASSMLVRGREALGIQSKSIANQVPAETMETFDRLFAGDEQGI